MRKRLTNYKPFQWLALQLNKKVKNTLSKGNVTWKYQCFFKVFISSTLDISHAVYCKILQLIIAVHRLIIRGCLFIYSCSQILKRQSILKQSNWAEHKYMDNYPHNYWSAYSTAALYCGRKQYAKTSKSNYPSWWIFSPPTKRPAITPILNKSYNSLSEYLQKAPALVNLFQCSSTKINYRI